MAKPKNFGTAWQFAIVNKRLTELFFDNRKIMGHCYVTAKDYGSKKEQKLISDDIKKLNLSYYNGKYRNKIDGKLMKVISKKSPKR